MLDKLKFWLSRPKSALFTCKTVDRRVASPKTVVVGNALSPTMDFYFRSRRKEFSDYCEVDISDDKWLTHPSLMDENALLILVRDVPLALLRKLHKNHQAKNIVWFIDDDIPAINEDKTLPKHYRHRLANWYRKAAPMLEVLCCQVWVSTPYLATRYHLPASSVLPPLQLPVNRQQMLRCFYHGSSSHTKEWEFVIELIKTIQAKYHNTYFELIGNHQLNKACRDIPRVNILHPLSWPNYQALLQSRTMDIGLAPLLDSSFNRARSHCKLLDIQRQNAIGIYSTRVSHADNIESYQAGFVAKDTLEDWLAAFDKVMFADKQRIFDNSTMLIEQLQSAAVTPQ